MRKEIKYLQIKKDAKMASNAIKKILSDLKSKYPLDGIDFIITTNKNQCVGININIDSEGYRAYFK